MRLHLLGIPHTVTTEAYSHCAFTGKVLRFPQMMVPMGYDIIHYGVEGADFGFHWGRTRSDQHGSLELVNIMTKDEQLKLMGHDESDPTKFYADDAQTGSPLYHQFNQRLRGELRARVTMDDLVLLPLGHAHWEALNGMPYRTVETGIGYLTLYEGAEFKIFESNAWMHWHQGKANRSGKNYEWVIPNYFDVDAWKVQLDPSPDLVVFLGRICDEKGMQVVVEVAKRRPDLKFVICGQGDPSPYLLGDNIIYMPPISGKIRSMLLGSAMAVLMPTKFTEPFGGVAVEAQLCGTPVLSTTYGGFTETIEDQVTGFRCHTLGDFLAGLERAPGLDRQAIADRARRLYGYDRVGRMYDRAFRQIQDLQGEGWYSTNSIFNGRSGHDMDRETAVDGNGAQQGISVPRRALPAAGGSSQRTT